MKLRVLGTIFLFFSVIGSPVQVYANNHRNTDLCGKNWGSESSAPEVGMLNIRSRCDVSNLTKTEITSFLKENEKNVLVERWPLQTTEVLYFYSLEIDNDGEENIELNLGNWNVTHSPYTWIAESFVYKIPACSRFALKFNSPWEPQLEIASINIGLRDKDGRWETIGTGKTSIVVPTWFHFFTPRIHIEQLPTDKAEMKVCKSAR